MHIIWSQCGSGKCADLGSGKININWNSLKEGQDKYIEILHQESISDFFSEKIGFSANFKKVYS